MRAWFAEHFKRHALFYCIAIGFGLQGFGSAFYDNFWPIEPADMARLGWWQIIAVFLKSVSVSIGIVVGYLIKGPTPPADSTPKPP